MSDRLDRFDPYHKWLGIPPADQPPNLYRLLGVTVFEDDVDVVASAADRQMAHIRTFQTGQHSADSQRLLNELAAARLCLLKPAEKAAYDSQLRGQLAPPQAAPSQPAPPQPLPVQMVPTPRPLAAAPSVRWAQAPVTVGVNVKSSSVVEPRVVIDKRRASSPARTYRRRSSGWPLAGVVTMAGAIVGCVIWKGYQERSQPSVPEIPKVRSTSKAPPDHLDTALKHSSDEDPQEPNRKPLNAVESIDGTLHTTEDDSTNDDHASDEAPEATQPPAANVPEPRETTDPSEFNALVAEVAPGFSTHASGPPDGVGIVAEHFGRRGVLRTHPVAPGEPCVLAATVDVLAGTQTNLVLDVSHHPRGDWQLIVKVNGNSLHDSIVGPTTATNGWIEVVVDLSPFTGQKIQLELLNQANDWAWEFGYWGRVDIESTTLPDDLALSARDADKRLPTPSNDLLDHARKNVDDRYGTELKQAKALLEAVTLAKKLIDDSHKAEDDAALRYALLETSREVAAAAGAAEAAMSAIERMTERFIIDDEVALKLATLAVAADATLNPRTKGEQLKAARELIDEAVDLDRYDEAKKAAALADAAANALEDDDVKKQIRESRADVEKLSKRYNNVKGSLAKLEITPDDADDNLKVGEFYCFTKGDWDRGLTYLARGGKERYRELAKRDLHERATPTEQRALGDAWFAASRSAGTLKPVLAGRAAHWYTLALPQLAASDRPAVEERLREINAQSAKGRVPKPRK